MKYFLSIFILLGIGCFKKASAQNLVPNSSFENLTSACPVAIGNIQIALTDWFEFGSADNFNSCDTTDYASVPQNVAGYQATNTGVDYVGLIGYYSTMFDREYIEVKLNTALTHNEIYFVQFYVSAADTMQYAIENLGALFTDTLFNPYPSSGGWITGIPQIENTPGNMLNDKLNWTLISGSFVAQGGEQYVTIGNFADDAHTVKQYFGGTTPNTLGAYYYIDDVYVGTTPLTGVAENKTEERNSKIYPNPGTGDLTLECNLQQEESGILFIYTLSGTVVKSYSLPAGAKTMAIDASALQAGLYVYEIRINGKAGKRNKLTIIK